MAEPIIIRGVDGLYERAGTDLGVSDWVQVEQDKITAFAKLTGDEQWIHVDPRVPNGPFGATVHTGFLRWGLSTGLLDQVFSVTDVGVVLITGSTASGFPRLCERAKRVRMHVALNEAAKLGEGSRWCTGFATKWRVRTNRAPSRSWSSGNYDLGADAALPLSGKQLRDTASTPNLRVPRRGVGRHLLHFSREYD